MSTPDIKKLPDDAAEIAGQVGVFFPRSSIVQNLARHILFLPRESKPAELIVSFLEELAADKNLGGVGISVDESVGASRQRHLEFDLMYDLRHYAEPGDKASASFERFMRVFNENVHAPLQRYDDRITTHLSAVNTQGRSLEEIALFYVVRIKTGISEPPTDDSLQAMMRANVINKMVIVAQPAANSTRG